MTRRLAATLLVTALAAVLLAPAGALAQAPFAPLPPAAGTTTEEALPTTTTTTEDQGLERWQEILIFLGGVVFVLGIGYAVLRDARKRAPVDDEDRYYRETADKSGPDPRKKAKARAKAKAQRQARRRNR
jgi:hypothetical protein